MISGVGVIGHLSGLSVLPDIGVDEVAWQKGHHYLTLVYQIDTGQKRLLHVSEGRTKESLKKFFNPLQKKGDQITHRHALRVAGHFVFA